MIHCSFCKKVVPEGVDRCPSCGRNPAEILVGEDRPATLIDTIPEVGMGEERMDEQYTPTMREPGAGRKSAQASAEPSSSDQSAVRRFRPLHRPPLALICICDDASSDGEWIRIRSAKVVIGRSEGDILIPHDGAMSGRHAEIRRTLIDGEFRWFIKDLDSRNGTFVRVTSCVLRHNDELLIGARRFRFDAAPRFEGYQEGKTAEAPTERKVTLEWKALTPDDLDEPCPALVEICPGGEQGRLALKKEENWIGSDSRQCSVVLHDPYISPRHARIYRDKQGRWQMESQASVNGSWKRISEQEVVAEARFQLGEQRFAMKVL